ncbi:hypothetical protein HC928_26205 [bacterium]|nr:hypothetical protein [bacterium]
MTLTSVKGDGGAVANRFLMQFTADMTGLAVHAANLPELSALGAVFSGLLGSSVYDSLAALEALPAGFEAYAPAMDPHTADRLYAGWQAAVQRVL